MENKKVLVVDDEPKILKVVEHSLRREGYQVTTAVDGEQALTMLEKVRPDLVVLDLMLPKIDGFEVCKRIKSERDIPVIILSARGEEVDKVVGFTLGADDYQTKPFSPTELGLRIKAILRRLGDSTKEQKQVLKFEELILDYNKRVVTLDNQKIETGGI